MIFASEIITIIQQNYTCLQVCQLLSVLFLCYLVVLPVFSCTLLLSSVSATIFSTIYTWYKLKYYITTPNYATTKKFVDSWWVYHSKFRKNSISLLHQVSYYQSWTLIVKLLMILWQLLMMIIRYAFKSLVSQVGMDYITVGSSIRHHRLIVVDNYTGASHDIHFM